jgi:hypothetical protein
MKKLRLLGLTTMLLALSLIFIGCGDGAGGEPDSWSSITNLDQLNGTWKGTLGDTLTIKKFHDNEGKIWDSSMQEQFGDISVKINMDGIYIINSNTGTESGTVKTTFTCSGGKIKDA